MAILFYPPKASPTSAGENYPLGTLTFYETGTSTLATIYSDAGLTTPLSNPVTASSAGVFAPIYLDRTSDYRVVLKNSGGSTIYDVDPFPASSDPLYPRTAIEITAGVIPSDYSYAPGDVRRYGATGDGVTDDTASFSSALTVAGAGGEGVYVPPASVYYRISSALTVPSNVAITGGNPACIIKQVTADTTCFTISGKENVAVRELHFQGAVDTTSTARVLINSSSDNVEVSGCWFSNLTHWGVHMDTATNVRITGNHFSDWVSPINGACAINAYNNLNFATITGNQIQCGATSATTGAYFGIGVLRSSGTGNCLNAVIANNVITGCREYGIVWYMNTETTDNVAITGNVISNIYGSSTNQDSGAGIYTVRARGMTIANNVISATNLTTASYTLAPAGIGLNGPCGNVSVVGNTVRDCYVNGIYAVGGLSDVTLSITGNTINKCRYAGIKIVNMDYTTITGNVVYTEALGTYTNTKALIVTGDSDTCNYISVTGNALYTSGGQLIVLTSVDYFTFAGNVVHCAAASTGDAIQFASCNYGAISGNTVYNTANTSGYCLYLSGTVGARVSGNKMRAAHSGQIYGTNGTCTDTHADSSNNLSTAQNSGTGSSVVLRSGDSPATGAYQTGDITWDSSPAAGGAPGWVYASSAWKTMAAIAA